MVSGRYGPYGWIVWNAQSLGDLLATFPDLLLLKYLVITSFDSGPLTLSDDERRTGWTTHATFAHSPQITPHIEPPYDQYDEWYVFEQPTMLHSAEVFINYSGFRLQPVDGASVPWEDPTSPDSMPRLQQRFWQQMQQIEPESYVAEGDNLIVATRNLALFERMLAWKLPRPERT